MIITYNPQNRKILKGRKEKAEEIFDELPYRYCFISGSFLFSNDYKDIDVFVITRSNKKVHLEDEKINVQVIDFNDLYSLFYHSVKKTCLAKNILPEKDLKTSIKEYWDIVNESLADARNKKKNFSKQIRSLILYTHYLVEDEILDSYDLIRISRKLNTVKKIENYMEENAPKGIARNSKKSYIQRFFYSFASRYKDLLDYKGMEKMYDLTHKIIEYGNKQAV